MQTKIALINPGRVGSTLLQFGLNGHPDIRMKGEVLADHAGTIDDECKGIAKRLFGIDLRGEVRDEVRHAISRAEYLYEIFGIADGIKLQTTHLIYDQILYYGMLSHLAHMTELKIIYLDRHPVHRHISLELACRDRIWHTFKGNEVAQRNKIVINKESLNRYISYHKHINDIIRYILRNIPSIEIWYEDLVSDWNNTTGQILDFLGYNRHMLPQAFHKTLPQDFTQIVENYDDIKDLINEPRTSF